MEEYDLTTIWKLSFHFKENIGLMAWNANNIVNQRSCKM